MQQQGDNPASFVEGTGLIVMMDALGMRSDNMEFARAQMNQIRNLKSRFKRYQDNFEKTVFKDEYIPYVLGDTFVFIFPLTTNPNISQIAQIAQRVTNLFHTTLDVEIMMRGAIAIGDYIVDHDENTLLGPGISDAANWCEKADWIGMTLTENAGEKLIGSEARLPDRHRFLEYSVPQSKGRSPKTLWALDWCSRIYTMHPSYRDTEREHLFELGHQYLLDKFPSASDIPESARSKYANTLMFYEFCVDMRRKYPETGTL